MGAVYLIYLSSILLVISGVLFPSFGSPALIVCFVVCLAARMMGSARSCLYFHVVTYFSYVLLPVLFGVSVFLLLLFIVWSARGYSFLGR